MILKRNFVLTGALALLLGACAADGGSRSTGAAQWGKSGQDSAARDQAFRTCRAHAEDEALRQAGPDPLGFGSLNSNDPRQQLSAFDTKRVYNRTLASCMESRGYSRTASPTRAIDDSVEDLSDSLRW